jgi:hypothetical protein
MRLPHSSEPGFNPFTQTQAYYEVGEMIPCPHLHRVIGWWRELARMRGPVISFVSGEQGTLFASLLGQSALEQNGEVVEGLFPMVNRHGPFA